MKPILIFDFDGTLIDSAPAILAGFETVLERAGIPPVTPLSSQLIGPPLLETLARITGAADPGLLAALADAFKAYYDSEGLLLTQAYQGVDAALRQLARRGFSLHLATNKRWHPTEKILKLLGWDPLFVSAYAQDKGAAPFANKTAMLGTLLSEQAIDARSAIYIGDTREDGQAAAANGLIFAAVDWGYGNFDGWQGLDRWARIPSPSALLDYIDSIASQNRGWT